MKITTEELKKIFSDLIEGNNNREYFSQMAKKLLQADDNNKLEYEPLRAKETMWIAIKYLSEVDLKDDNGKHLRSISDLIDFAKHLRL